MRDDFTTKRLQMRPLVPADAPGLLVVFNDYDVVKMTGTWPWPVDLAYVEDRLAKSAERDKAANYGVGIFLDGTLIGSMGGHIEPHHESGAEVIWIGYTIGKPWWGKGYATEAVSALIPALRRHLPLLDIYAEHFFDNPASGRVMIKAGFEHVGPAPLVWCEARQQKLPGEQYVLREAVQDKGDNG